MRSLFKVLFISLLGMKQFVISAFLTNFLSGAIKQVLLYLILQELLVCLFTVSAAGSEPCSMSPGECECVEAEVMDVGVGHVYIFSSLIFHYLQSCSNL